MANVNNQNIHGDVNQVNGVKIENAYFTQTRQQQNARSKMLKELLLYRHHCYELHILLCNYAKERFGLKEAPLFVDLSDQQLTQLYQFSQPLRKVFFVYQEKIQDPKHKLAYRLAFFLQPLMKFFYKTKNIK